MNYQKKPSVFFVGEKKPNAPDIPTLSVEKIEECKKKIKDLREPRWHKYPNEKPPYSEEEEMYLVCYEYLSQDENGDDVTEYAYTDAIYDGEDFYIRRCPYGNIDRQVKAWKTLNLFQQNDEGTML